MWIFLNVFLYSFCTKSHRTMHSDCWRDSWATTTQDTIESMSIMSAVGSTYCECVCVCACTAYAEWHTSITNLLCQTRACRTCIRARETNWWHYKRIRGDTHTHAIESFSNFFFHCCFIRIRWQKSINILSENCPDGCRQNTIIYNIYYCAQCVNTYVTFSVYSLILLYRWEWINDDSGIELSQCIANRIEACFHSFIPSAWWFETVTYKTRAVFFTIVSILWFSSHPKAWPLNTAIPFNAVH